MLFKSGIPEPTPRNVCIIQCVCVCLANAQVSFISTLGPSHLIFVPHFVLVHCHQTRPERERVCGATRSFHTTLIIQHSAISSASVPDKYKFELDVSLLCAAGPLKPEGPPALRDLGDAHIRKKIKESFNDDEPLFSSHNSPETATTANLEPTRNQLGTVSQQQ